LIEVTSAGLLHDADVLVAHGADRVTGFIPPVVPQAEPTKPSYVTSTVIEHRRCHADRLGPQAGARAAAGMPWSHGDR